MISPATAGTIFLFNLLFLLNVVKVIVFLFIMVESFLFIINLVNGCYVSIFFIGWLVLFFWAASSI